jgi:hypothetical protein
MIPELEQLNKDIELIEAFRDFSSRNPVYKLSHYNEKLNKLRAKKISILIQNN